METLVSEVMGLDTFSEERMDAVMEKAIVKDGTVIFYFFDGHTESCNYEEKKKGVPHTEEHKKYMSKLMKERGKQLKRKRGNK